MPVLMAGTPAAEHSAQGTVLACGELPARCCSPGATTTPKAGGCAGAVTRRQKAIEYLQNPASSKSHYLSLSCC